MSSGRWIRMSLALVSLAACGDDGGATKDAAPDVAMDTPGGCTGSMITGEIVDWDANRTTFCGVFNAALTVRGMTGLTDTTNPNGRFELCVPSQAQSLVQVTFSAAPSECTTPKDTYPVGGVLVIDNGVAPGTGEVSARAMTAARQATMFTQVGAAYDAAKAQLVVHVAGGSAGTIAISAAHAATQAFDGTTWAAGTTGQDVFFPNVTPGASTVTYGAGTMRTLTLEAGVFTYLSIQGPLPAR